MSSKFLLVLLTCLLPAAGNNGSGGDPDEGMEGSIRLGIPEPMVFDLVRPLGAAKGEFEVNSLFVSPVKGGGRLNWAPEIEYAFGRGLAAEFELPIAGLDVESYKMAAQQKLPAGGNRRFAHGLQGIGVVKRGGAGWETSGLYLLGVRWRERWSTMSMYGANHSRASDSSRTLPLINNTLFYERWRHTVLGVETNLKGVSSADAYLLVIPQMHVRLGQRFNLQFGAGYQRASGERSAVVSCRLIREL